MDFMLRQAAIGAQHQLFLKLVVPAMARGLYGNPIIRKIRTVQNLKIEVMKVRELIEALQKHDPEKEVMAVCENDGQGHRRILNVSNEKVFTAGGDMTLISLKVN